MHIGFRHPRPHERGDRAAATAQVHDDVTGLTRVRSVPSQSFGPTSRHEHPGVDQDPQPAEVGPTKQMLERLSPCPLADQRRDITARVDQQHGFVLGEHATRGVQLRDDVAVRRHHSH